MVSLFLVCLLITVASKPIAQASDYHHFVDQYLFMGSFADGTGLYEPTFNNGR